MTFNRPSPLPPLPAPLPARTTAYPLLLLMWEWRAVHGSGINLLVSPWKVAAANRAVSQPISHLFKSRGRRFINTYITSRGAQPTTAALIAPAAPAPLCCLSGSSFCSQAGLRQWCQTPGPLGHTAHGAFARLPLRVAAGRTRQAGK